MTACVHLGAAALPPRGGEPNRRWAACRAGRHGGVTHPGLCRGCPGYAPAPPPAAAASAARPPCRHEGGVVSWCPRGDEGLHVRRCDHPAADRDLCTRAANNGRAQCCGSCPDYSPPVSFPVRLDERNCWPGLPGLRKNPSLLAWRGGYLFAWRTGWEGSDVYLGRLDAAFRPTGDAVRLDLTHPAAHHGREDPRLFLHAGRLHVMFVGTVARNRAVTGTNVLYARLRDDLTTERVYAPDLAGRQGWEKNWGFFSHDGTLYAVYSIASHRVLRIDGDRAEWAYDEPTPAPWDGGELRGGAAPVRVGDEYWCFFHDRVEPGGHRVYRAGLYTFEARPPFRPQRIIPTAIDTADRATNPGNYASVVFPCGAVRAGPEWVLSVGVHDRWSELRAFGHADLERRLARIAPPHWWRWRGQPNESAMYSSVNAHDEYRVRDLIRPGMKVLDVGGHVGFFAHLAGGLGAAVHSYEPCPASADCLEHNAGHMGGRVTVFREAVGPAPGRCRVEEHGEATSNRTADDPAGDVPVVPLAAALDRLGGRCDLLKLDCEGAEWGILAGAGADGSLARVDLVVGEYHPAGWDGRAWTGADLPGLLEPHGFRVEVEPRGEHGLGFFRAER